VNLEAVRQIADAVLYEGYLLYPYRASAVKNRSRWQFGVVMPVEYTRIDPSERAYTQAEFVVESAETAAVTVALRFLHVQARTVQRWTGQRFVAADALDVDGTRLTAWEEAVGRVIRNHRELSGTVTVSARPVPGPWQAVALGVRVDNRTPLVGGAHRAAALRCALVASHTVVGVTGGAALSMVDPPEWAAGAVAGCVNVGSWPVLAGPPEQRQLVLCAPIILYDYPQIAPESTGDLFDATEIDELLTLRTLTLSEAEKREARATDPRAAAVIDRTEALALAEISRLHGAIREVRTVAPQTVVIAGTELRSGSRVRLRPGVRRSDAQDMFLVGRIAMVEAVLVDVDGNPYLAVTLVDDPAAELQRDHGRFRYFAPDEVEPCVD